jgi:hypothetical protein
MGHRLTRNYRDLFWAFAGRRQFKQCGLLGMSRIRAEVEQFARGVMATRSHVETIEKSGKDYIAKSEEGKHILTLRHSTEVTLEFLHPGGLDLVSKDVSIADKTTRLPKAVPGFVTAIPEALFCYVLHLVERQAIEPHAYVSLVHKLTAYRP